MVYPVLEFAVTLTLPFTVDALSFLLGLTTGVLLILLTIVVIWLAVKL